MTIWESIKTISERQIQPRIIEQFESPALPEKREAETPNTQKLWMGIGTEQIKLPWEIEESQSLLGRRRSHSFTQNLDHGAW